MQLAAITEQLEALAGVLSAEREALETRAYDDLEAISEAKRALCESLAQPEIVALLQRLSEDPTNCDPAHDSLRGTLESLRDANLINGRLLTRNQNTLREIIGIVSGHAGAELYSESGQPARGRGADGDIITRV